MHFQSAAVMGGQLVNSTSAQSPARFVILQLKLALIQLNFKTDNLEEIKTYNHLWE